MRLDHIVFAAGPGGLAGTTERLSALLGEDFSGGGVHPRFGTRNSILPLTEGTYLEVVEVLDHPASDKAPFGQAVRAASEAGGGWLGWVVAVDDIGKVEARLGRESVPGNRHRPDGTELKWRQLGIKGLMADPQVPYFIEWDDMTVHPSAGADTSVRIDHLQIAGDPKRVREWLGPDDTFDKGGIDFTFLAPHGTPGLLSVTFDTPDGKVTI